MQRSHVLLALVLCCAASPTRAGVFHPASNVKRAQQDRWMVLLAAPGPVERLAHSVMQGHGQVDHIWKSALRGFLATMPLSDAKTVAADPRVAGVYQDAALDNPFSTPLPDCSEGVALAGPLPFPVSPESITCTDPDPQNPAGTCTDNWGLDRLDGTTVGRDGVYAPARNGQGVNIFLVDTGLYAQHQEFTGRVGEGTDATGGGGTPDDCGSWSHGTHVAGIAAGTRFGVAKGAILHPVRVAPCPLNVVLSSLVTAYDWIAQTHATTVTGPAVASMSINSTDADFHDPAQPLGVAIAGVLNAGVLVIESAGNNVQDACGHVVGVPGVLIVGGSDEMDHAWTRIPGDPNYAGWCGTDCGSNLGSCVDVFAPAAHIVSSWLGMTPDPQNTCRLSGTSMAAPHAAGVAAQYLQANPTATAAQVKQALLSRALPVLTQLPAATTSRLVTVLDGAPALSLAPAVRLDFGPVTVGATSVSQRLTITSGGALPLHVGAPSLSGSMAAAFSVVANTCGGGGVAPPGNCTMDVTMTPATGGPVSASLVFSSDDPAHGQVTFPLTGVGLPLVTVQKGGNGMGTVTSDPAGISCGTLCSAPFTTDVSLVLTAHPAAGSAFAGWAGVAGCSGGTCVTLVGASSMVVTATFVLSTADGGTVDAARGDGAVPDAARADGADAGMDVAADGGDVRPGGCGCLQGGSAAPWVALLALVWTVRRSARRSRHA